MHICRTLTAIGCLGSVCLLVGCGVVPGDADVGANGFLSVGVDGFGGNHPLVVEADKATSQSTTVSLSGDLLEDAPDDAAIMLSAADITVTINGELSGRKNPAAKTAPHHASITFRFGPQGENACDSDDKVGPFELTVENGVVTLAEESLPLDARARSITRNGKFEICTETWADFDGSISLASFSFEFGQLRGNEQRVVLCHVPSGNPDNPHAITVGAPAVDAHLAHGDYLGECDGSDAEEESDGDDDGVGDGDANDDDPGGVDEDGTDGEEDDDADDNAKADGGDAEAETSEADDPDDDDGTDSGEDDDADDNAEADGGDAEDETSEADDPDDDDENDANDDEDDDPDDNAEADGGDADDEGTEADDLDDDDEDDANDDENGVTGGGGAGGGGGGTPDAGDNDKGDRENVVICHIPPGNPDRRHTIAVSEAAIDAHLAHGDLLGECDEDEEDPDVEDGDSDGDGVRDDDDACPGTPAGHPIGADGCSCSQKDTDSDGVNDCDDQCSGTTDGVEVDTDGCSCSQKDADSDGVNDCDDQCSGTAGGSEVDADGCSCAQLGHCAYECQADADCIDDLACAEYLCVEGYCAPQFADQVRFVDSSAGGANDGSRWEDAYVDLQDALAEATANERIAEIWVASAGGKPYTPAGPGGSRSVSFELMNCLGIYGGFDGGEVYRDQRDPNANVTILSGDLDGDDDAGGGIDENSYHVVVSSFGDATTVLDGVTITAGNADGVYPENFGGGMFSFAGSTTVRNCIFVRNTGNSGGGMSIRGGYPTVSHCVFVSNTAMVGGGIHSSNTTTYDIQPTVADCSFIENVVTVSGGGIYVSNGAPGIVRCQFVGNAVNSVSGGSGGGIAVWGTADQTVTLTDCLLSRNWAGYNGGAIWSVGSTLALRNVTIASNASSSFGGGLYVSLEAPAIPDPVVSNSKSVISNCIFWNNQDSSGETETSQIYSPESESDPLVCHTIIQGLDLYRHGAGNIDEDPLFVSDDNLRLQENSPAIDSGDPNTVLNEGDTDLDGNARVQGGGIDRGAYEFTAP